MFFAALAALVVVAARGLASHDDEGEWTLVARDSGVTAFVDTTRFVRDGGRLYGVWYRTDHAQTRFYSNKSFNREVVRVSMRCNDFAFRVVSSTLSNTGGAVVNRQVNTSDEVAHQTWHAVDAGSTDAEAARATCELLRHFAARR